MRPCSSKLTSCSICRNQVRLFRDYFWDQVWNLLAPLSVPSARMSHSLAWPSGFLQKHGRWTPLWRTSLFAQCTLVNSCPLGANNLTAQGVGWLTGVVGSFQRGLHALGPCWHWRATASILAVLLAQLSILASVPDPQLLDTQEISYTSITVRTVCLTISSSYLDIKHFEIWSKVRELLFLYLSWLF